MVHALLDDLRLYCSDSPIEVILTINVEEPLLFDICEYEFPVRLIKNTSAKGFGENHNAAFYLATGKFFCVLNPDIRLTEDPFPILIKYMQECQAGLIAPRVVNNDRVQEDSARNFPSPSEIMQKLFGGKSAFHIDTAGPITSPDWVAGMFMLFPHEVFQKIGGFDERYFLYYEDVDLCARLTLANYRIFLCSTVSVVHDARRSSHKNLRYMRLHLTSMLRFFFSSVYRKLQQRAAC